MSVGAAWPVRRDRLLAFLARPFRPPFVGLPLVVWLYFVGCFLLHPQSGIMRGHLPDVDDYMMLNHTLDWLRGQGWYDVIQYRLAPPEGVMIHFSRLTETPIAALILLLGCFGVAAPDAAIAAAVILPPLYLAALFAVMRWVAVCFMPRDWARVTAYTALFSGYLLSLYSPGRIDHHALANLIVALGFGFTLRMMLEPEKRRWSLGAGLFLALALAVALETLPWVMALSLWIGLWLVVEGRVAARSAAIFGLALYLVSAVLLALYRAPSQWLEPDTHIFAMPYVVLTGSMALCFAGVALAARTRFVWLRYAVAFLLGLVLAAAFFRAFPQMLVGPYGGLDNRLSQTFFNNISEAIPLIRGGSGLELVMPLLALDASVAYASRAEGRMRWLWWLNVFLLTAALLLGLLYQSRCLVFGYLFGIVPLAALLQRGWQKIAARYRGRRRFAAEIGLLLLVGPLPWVLVPAWFDGRAINPGMVMFPVEAEDRRCDLDAVARVLNGPEFYKGSPLTLMNFMGSGSTLLFLTPHKVTAAPYFNVRGNLDAVRFFSTPDPAVAKAIARRAKIDLVVFCHLVPGVYHGMGGPHQTILDVNDPASAASDAFVAQIAAGKLPPWLTRLRRDDIGPFLLFRVEPPAAGHGAD